MKQALIGILIAIGLYSYGHHKGWSERDAEMQAEIAIKNEEARAKEQELNQKLNDNEAKLLEVNNVINEKQSALDRAIRAGRVRFPSSCVQAGNVTTAAPVGGVEAASESERQTLAAIAEIVAQGDRNTEQLNACIDAYNQVREMVNGQR
jgi:F0F1-type ATP synthase membrane subunit b/b'